MRTSLFFLLARLFVSLARGTARLFVSLARGAACFDIPLARGAARFDLALLLLCVGALSSAAGCGSPGAFSTTFPLNHRPQLNAVLAQIAAAPRSAQTPVVVGVSDNPRGLFAYDLAGQRLLFSTPTDVRGVPVAAGPFVVAPEGQRVRVRELTSGRVVQELDASGLNFVGADSDGTITAVVLSSGGSYGARSLLVIMRGEQISKKLWVEQALGIPAVLGGLTFVPHSRVHLSVISPEGEEQLRLTVRDDVASEALSDGRQVYFGLAGVYRLDSATPDGVKGGAHYFAPDPARRRQLPGGPAFLRDSSEAPAPVDSAVHRIKLSFWPSSSGDQVGAADAALYLSFYRLVFSLSESLESASWVRSTPSDIVGSAAHPGGVVVVEERGTVSAFDTAGSRVLEAELGVRPLVASVRAEGVSGHGAGDSLPPLVEQLGAAVLHDDTRLVPAGELAVRMMAALPDAEVTSTLITICSQQEAPRRLRESACTELAGRKQGNDAILTALSKRNDFLADTSAAPIAPLAKAAANAGETKASALLLDHLEDPSTASDDLPAIVNALAKIADAGVRERLTRFVRLYHADAIEPPLAEALVAAVPLLSKLDTSAANSLLTSFVNDPRCDPALRQAAEKELAALAKQAGNAEGGTAAAGEQGPATSPVHLGAEHMAHALAPVRDELSQCLRNDPAHPREARLTVIVDGASGKVLSAETLPSSLKGCVEPIVRKASLPITSSGKRETLHYSISH
jgi:hypothetical protein